MTFCARNIPDGGICKRPLSELGISLVQITRYPDVTSSWHRVEWTNLSYFDLSIVLASAWWHADDVSYRSFDQWKKDTDRSAPWRGLRAQRAAAEASALRRLRGNKSHRERSSSATGYSHSLDQPHASRPWRRASHNKSPPSSCRIHLCEVLWSGHRSGKSCLIKQVLTVLYSEAQNSPTRTMVRLFETLVPRPSAKRSTSLRIVFRCPRQVSRVITVWYRNYTTSPSFLHRVPVDASVLKHVSAQNALWLHGF